MSLILLRFTRPQCLAATHLSSPEVGNGRSWPNAMVTSQAPHSTVPTREYYAVIQRAQCWWATTCGCRDEESNSGPPSSEKSILLLGHCHSPSKEVTFTLQYIIYITLFYITSHHITSHYITLHYIILHYITLHYIIVHYITLHYITLHYITLHYITLHYITLHYITLHYITLHYITLHYITLHYIT